jgi:hypothetical protein
MHQTQMLRRMICATTIADTGLSLPWVSLWFGLPVADGADAMGVLLMGGEI